MAMVTVMMELHTDVNIARMMIDVVEVVVLMAIDMEINSFPKHTCVAHCLSFNAIEPITSQLRPSDDVHAIPAM